MQIAVCARDQDCYAREIVRAALVRSFSAAQVSTSAADVSDSNSAVWINPLDASRGEIERLLRSGGKAVVLGRLSPAVADLLGISLCGDVDWPSDWAQCACDPSGHHDSSPLAVRYLAGHPLAKLAPRGERPLCRFDFAQEWNNLGFGRITLDGSAWSLQSAATPSGATPLACVADPGGRACAYATLTESASGAVLWFNRPVGPVDSLEWRLLESFLADYRADDLPCFPAIAEIPANYQGVVCPRLDCDEAVASGRSMFELYRSRGLVLSMALLTGQALDDADLDFLGEVIGGGGAVVSHSVRHAPNWGGDYQRACAEACESRSWIEEHLPSAAPVRFAVSPFHQNPPYAVSALADSGYAGFIGGIIANDPEFLLGRAGRVPLVSRPIVSLSAQCMLHGDCYHRYGDSADVYCQSFDQHLAAGSMFAYLDHPFSDRYQYGWRDEPERLAAHAQLIEHIGRQDGIWWANINQALDFLCARDAALVESEPGSKLSVAHAKSAHRLPLGIRWKGRQFAY